MVLESLKNLKKDLQSEDGGLAGTGLFSKSPDIDFATKPEAKIGPYKGITGAPGEREDPLKRMLHDEEAKKLFEKELAKQLAREKKRQVRELAKHRARQNSKASKGSDITPDIIGGGSEEEVDIVGDVDTEVEKIRLI